MKSTLGVIQTLAGKNMADTKAQWDSRERVLRSVMLAISGLGQVTGSVRDKRGSYYAIPACFSHMNVSGGIAHWLYEKGNSDGQLDNLIIDEKTIWPAMARVIIALLQCFEVSDQDAMEYVLAELEKDTKGSAEQKQP